MSDRAALVEAGLEIYPEGLALLDQEGRVMYWNRAAELFTGHAAANIVGRPIPAEMEGLTACLDSEREPAIRNGAAWQRGTLVHTQHSNGRDLPAIARKVVLRDGLGKPIGMAVVFHAAMHNAALPHGETSEGLEVKESQSELTNRLECDFQGFIEVGQPLGVLWVGVDQARALRGTHGARASEAMLESIERTLANGLRPGEEVGRWGDDEFLLICHESDGETLANRGQVLAGLARTTVFRWWGDRVSLTVSVGAAEARSGDALAQLLERAQQAMLVSIRNGGNQVSSAPRGQACLRS